MRSVATACGGLVCVLAVAAAGCGDEVTRASSPTPTASASPTPTSTPAANSGGYRVVGDPLIFFGPAPSRGPRIFVFVRLNKKLPRAKLEEGADANFLVDGSGGLDAPPERVGRRTRACYFGNLSNGNPASTLAHPSQGQQVKLSVLVARGRYQVDVPGTLRGPMDAHHGLTPRRQMALVGKLCGKP